jgi:hypothetical protein
MTIKPWIGVAGLLAVAMPAHAERPDCALFPDMHSRMACYDNVSRAPPPEPKEAAKPDATKPRTAIKAAIIRNRKTRTN